MSDIWILAQQVAAKLPRSGYEPISITGPMVDHGGPTTMRGWVLVPGSRKRVRVGNRFDDRRTGAWKDLTTTQQTLVLAHDGAIWVMDHVHGASGTTGAVSSTTRLAPASIPDISEDPIRHETVERALRRLQQFSE